MQYSKKHKRTCFGNWISFLSSGEGWETPILLGPSERVHLNLTDLTKSPTHHLRIETDPFSEMLGSFIF
jgi:hypothetical protein